ncbi:MAG: hypothetical protein HOV81_22135 [Kofleriaceae bacterium]|nr:hypothetical protein [Kofleriaceae bacterium]
MQVTGCDDPTVWTAPPLRAGRISSEVGVCDWTEHPLSTAFLGWGPADGTLSPEEQAQLAGGTGCWRVVDAQPGSGWTAGQQFTEYGPLTGFDVYLMGFNRSVTFEGRILYADGTVAFATDAASVALRDLPKVLEADARDVIAVMSPEAWAESNAVVLWGQRIATDPVVDGIDRESGPLAGPRTLNRTADGLVVRLWRNDGNGTITHVDTLLGQGTTARFVGSESVVIDDELLFLGVDNGVAIVERRFPLGGEPLEAVLALGGVMLHMNGALVSYSRTDGLVASRNVSDGVLIRGPRFLEDTTFHALRVSQGSIEYEHIGSFGATQEELAALGKPLGIGTGNIVFGANGLLSGYDRDASPPGPRFAPFSDLVGDGHLGPISAGARAYVIERADGTAVLYEPRYFGTCL